MKNLIYKEFKLAAHPTTWLFLGMCLLMLIPNYPYYVGSMYVCLSMFFIFQIGKENKDVFYTVLLPVRKQDVVKARCMMISLIELTQILLSIPFAMLSVRINPTGSNAAGIDANVALFGFIFIMFAVFNIIFIPIFYKTAYKAGTAFLYSGMGIILFYAAVESLVWFPTPVKTFLDTSKPEMMLKQLPILIAGILLWVLTMFLAYRKAAANFEKVDL